MGPRVNIVCDNILKRWRNLEEEDKRRELCDRIN